MDKLVALIGVIVVVLILAAIFAVPFMFAWNYAMVAAVSVANPINFYQAFVLMFMIAFYMTGSNTSK